MNYMNLFMDENKNHSDTTKNIQIIGFSESNGPNTQKLTTNSLFKKNNYKEKDKRVVTKTSKWDFDITDFTPENQFSLLKKLQDFQTKDDFSTENILPIKEKCLLQELNKKIYGYKAQDMLKKLYDETKFVSIDYVLSLLIETELKCFYCKEDVNIIYEPIREPKQWSLERIDNSYGHNKDNVTIACLSCNLRRRTMYHERYVFTKQLCVIKMDASGNTEPK